MLQQKKKSSLAEKIIVNETLKVVKETESKLDEQLRALDNIDQKDLLELRKKRLNELQDKSKKIMEWKMKGHGKYSEIQDQKDWFAEIKANDRVICHFYRGSTWRCEIVDKHLTILAQKHLETRFIKIDAEKSPFLAEKLNIVLMPTIICTKDQFTLDTIEGFDQLGGKDDFTTAVLEKRLSIKGAIDIDESELVKPVTAPKKNV